MNDQPPIEAPQNREAEDQHEQMTHFGVTAEQKIVYHYQGHVYERLADALTYAKIDTARTDTARGTPSQEDVQVTSGHAQPR